MSDRNTNPWTIKSSKELLLTPWFRMRQDAVLDPSGKPGTYFVIEARPALGVVALTARNTIVLVGQYRYPLNAWSWEIPEGGGEPGEDLQTAAARELAEETGYQATVWEKLGHVHTSNCFTNETGYIFLARELVAGEARPDSTEKLEVIEVGLKEALAMIRHGEITDAISVAALYFYRDRLEQCDSENATTLAR